MFDERQSLITLVVVPKSYEDFEDSLRDVSEEDDGREEAMRDLAGQFVFDYHSQMATAAILAAEQTPAMQKATAEVLAEIVDLANNPDDYQAGNKAASIIAYYETAKRAAAKTAAAIARSKDAELAATEAKLPPDS